jgi:hypothetical protein
MMTKSSVSTLLSTSSNVQDNARIYVAALIFGDVQSERLFAFASPYHWNEILAAFREVNHHHTLIEDIPKIDRDLSKVGNGRAEELLNRFGRGGWTSLEESVQRATKGWVKSFHSLSISMNI